MLAEMARRVEIQERVLPRKPEKYVSEEKSGQRCHLPRRPGNSKTPTCWSILATGGLLLRQATWRGRRRLAGRAQRGKGGEEGEKVR